MASAFETPGLSLPAHSHRLLTGCLVGLLVLLPSALIVGALNADGPSEDGGWYMNAALSLARGAGYQASGGQARADQWYSPFREDFLWPGKPTAWHPPLWPFVASLPLWVWHFQRPISGVHIAALLMHYGQILGAVWITEMLSGSLLAMFAAGLSVSLWPAALVAIVAGDSEPCVGAVIALGAAMLMAGGKRFWLGVGVLSLMPLVRSNFTILPFFVLALLSLRSRGLWTVRPALLVVVVLFYLPTVCWVARNYAIMGAPVLATNQGASLYGNYNSVSARLGGPRFADWIHPSLIPGETKMEQLATTMSEPEISHYYTAKAIQFARSHAAVVPVVVAGHIVRALLPQHSAAPRRNWKWSLPEWICRVALYGIAVWLLLTKRLPFGSWYGVMLAAVGLSCVTTVALFFGEQRYLWPCTLLLVPFVCLGITSRLPARPDS